MAVKVLIRRKYPKDKTIHELFEEQVKQTPDNISVVGKAPSAMRCAITYRELNDKSTRLAHLLQERGVVPDTTAAIMVPRCVEMIIGIIGILKAGGPIYPLIRSTRKSENNIC